MTVDGIDVRIQEPQPFSSIWYSHKFNGPGLRYELGVAIQTGRICWINGPYPPGDFPDLEIFRLYLKDKLDDFECVEADEGYRGDDKVRTPHDYERNPDWKVMKANARARHEAINGRLKNFKILTQAYRGDRNNHHLVFNAIAFIVNVEIIMGRGTWQVDYEVIRDRQV